MSLPQSSKQEGINLKAIREQFNSVYPMAQRYVDYFAPDYAQQTELKKDISHLLLTRQEGSSQVELNAIRLILRVRGRAAYVRPIAEKKDYQAKQFDLSDDELQELPEMERMAVIMRDRLGFEPFDICNLLQLNNGQLHWLYFNVDSILGKNRGTAGWIGNKKITASELNKAWSIYAAAFYAKPIHRAPGVIGKLALTYISITLVALLGILGIGQLYLNLRTQTQESPTVSKNQKKDLGIAKSRSEKRKENTPIVLKPNVPTSKSITMVARRSSIGSWKPKSTNTAITVNRSKITLEDSIASQDNHTKESENVAAVATIPTAIGIHSQKKPTSSSLLGRESRRISGTLPLQKKKYIVFARIGMNSMRMHNAQLLTSGNIALGLKVNIQSRIALRISAGIAHVSHKSETLVQKQYQAPTISSPVVIDSVIFNGLRVGQLHLSQEMQVTKNIIVHAGGLLVYRMANIGKSFTSNPLNVESTPIQRDGVISQHQAFDFANFNRDPLYSRLLGGVCAGVSWRPPLLSHKMLLRAEFNYLPLYRRVNGPVPISRSAEMQLIIEI